MKIVFFGTPDYVIPVLSGLHSAFKTKTEESPIAAIVTQKPKPAGRKQQIAFSPVDTWAHKKNLKIFYSPQDIIDQGIHADIGILASYGAIIPKEVIEYFPKGILNIHPSLLPKFRGSSPVQSTIVEGKVGGSTIIEIDEKLDHGAIVSQFEENINEKDTTDSLRRRLFNRSGEVLVALIPAYIARKIKSRKQDHAKASFTREIKKDDAIIKPEFVEACMNGNKLKEKWEIPFIKNFTLEVAPINVHNFINAMQPWPVAWTTVKLGSVGKIKRLKIHESHLEKGILVLDSVQLEGKNIVTWQQFKQGYPNTKFLS